MNKPDRERLTKVLSAHVGRVASDLRAQIFAEGPVQDRGRRDIITPSASPMVDSAQTPSGA